MDDERDPQESSSVTDMQPTGLTRNRLRAVVASVNGNRDEHADLIADVLATLDQNGSSLTFYRRLTAKTGRPSQLRSVEPIYRVTILADGVPSYQALQDYGGQTTPEEQEAIEAILAMMMQGMEQS